MKPEGNAMAGWLSDYAAQASWSLSKCNKSNARQVGRRHHSNHPNFSGSGHLVKARSIYSNRGFALGLGFFKPLSPISLSVRYEACLPQHLYSGFLFSIHGQQHRGTACCVLDHTNKAGMRDGKYPRSRGPAPLVRGPRPTLRCPFWPLKTSALRAPRLRPARLPCASDPLSMTILVQPDRARSATR